MGPKRPHGAYLIRATEQKEQESLAGYASERRPSVATTSHLRSFAKKFLFLEYIKSTSGFFRRTLYTRNRTLYRGEKRRHPLRDAGHRRAGENAYRREQRVPRRTERAEISETATRKALCRRRFTVGKACLRCTPGRRRRSSPSRWTLPPGHRRDRPRRFPGSPRRPPRE